MASLAWSRFLRHKILHLAYYDHFFLQFSPIRSLFCIIFTVCKTRIDFENETINDACKVPEEADSVSFHVTT